MVQRMPYGSWPSPVSAELLVSGAATPTDVFAEDGITWWSETRPAEGGRIQLVRRDPDGVTSELLPPDGNARTRVHEYGGGAWWVDRGTVYYVEWADQRLYRIDGAPGDRSGAERSGAQPLAISPTPPSPHAWRYADGRLAPDAGTVVCVREDHTAGEARNEIVAIPAAGGDAVALATGRDFVAAPRISPDGRRLAWLTWDHPNMPWDQTELWVGELSGTGAQTRLDGARRVAGGAAESLVQPEWAPDGGLYVISDRSDWWNVYRVVDVEELEPVHPVAADVGEPAWVFGQSRYVLGDDGSVLLTYSRDAVAHLVTMGPGGAVTSSATPFVSLTQLRFDSGRVVALATEATREPSVVEFTSSADRGPAVTVVRRARDLGLAESGISRPRHVSFPSHGGRASHAWFYPPTGTDLAGLDGELPPLLVLIHGGPTGAASPDFRLDRQFWTSRGFALVDVDYGGSTGYGRPYRQLLDGAWGVVDVDDACAAAQWLADQRLVDGDRLAIRGGSAGGYTTLAALSTLDVFRAGASYYGVTDLAALAKDTHKFESRYLDRLVGPWPEAADVYAERSPLSHVDGFDRPLIVLQGDEDAVVPPAQAQLIVDALARRRVPHAYLLFHGEQHGFRKAENIVRAITAELYFYSRVFGFELPDDIPPVEIAFADRLPAHPNPHGAPETEGHRHD